MWPSPERDKERRCSLIGSTYDCPAAKQPSAAQRSERRRTMSRLGSGLYRPSYREGRTGCFCLMASSWLILRTQYQSCGQSYSAARIGAVGFATHPGRIERNRPRRVVLRTLSSPSSVTPTVRCPAPFKRHAPAAQGFEAARTLRAKA